MIHNQTLHFGVFALQLRLQDGVNRARRHVGPAVYIHARTGEGEGRLGHLIIVRSRHAMGAAVAEGDIIIALFPAVGLAVIYGLGVAAGGSHLLPVARVFDAHFAGIAVGHKGILIIHAVGRHHRNPGPLILCTVFCNLLSEYVQVVVAVPIHSRRRIGQAALRRRNLAVVLRQVPDRAVESVHSISIQCGNGTNAPILGVQIDRLAVIQNIGLALENGLRLREAYKGFLVVGVLVNARGGVVG